MLSMWPVSLDMKDVFWAVCVSWRVGLTWAVHYWLEPEGWRGRVPMTSSAVFQKLSAFY